MIAYKDELQDTLARLMARFDGTMTMDLDTSMEEQVTALAAALGAEDPYLAVLYPEHLDAILANKQPEWMQSGADWE